MDRLSSYAVDLVSMQLALLNCMLFVYLICRGAAFVSSVVLRRDPPKKSNRQQLARADDSKTKG